jgi:hypothetical protein
MQPNQQIGLDFGRLYRVDECYVESMRWVQEAYRQAGNLAAAGATGIDKGDLSKMFEPGSGRHMRFKAVLAFGALQTSSLEIRRNVLAPVAECFGLSVCDPLPPITKEQRCDVAESVIASLGPLAQEAYRNALGGRR